MSNESATPLITKPGFRTPKLKDTRELNHSVAILEQQVQQLSQNLQNVASTFFNILNRTRDGILGQVKQIHNNIEVVDYRTLALQKILFEKSVLTEAEIASRAEFLQINDFNEQSDLQDKNTGAKDVEAGTVASDGHVVVFGCVAKHGNQITIKNKDGQEEARDNPLAGQPFLPFCLLRNKATLGQNQLPPALEQGIKGLKIGDTNTFIMNVTPEVPIEVTVTIYSIKELPSPPEPVLENKETESQEVPEQPALSNAVNEDEVESDFDKLVEEAADKEGVSNGESK